MAKTPDQKILLAVFSKSNFGDFVFDRVRSPMQTKQQSTNKYFDFITSFFIFFLLAKCQFQVNEDMLCISFYYLINETIPSVNQ